MRRIFVLGSYGCGNRGDDAILQSIVESLSAAQWEFSATCGKFEDISKWLPVKVVPCRLNEGFSIPVLFSMLKNGVKMLNSILRSDMLVFGGGSLIHDLTPYNLPFLFLWHCIAKLFNKRIVYFCMGVGPINTEKGKKLCKKYLTQADALFVRDQRGYDICRDLEIDNAKMVNDSVFLLKDKNQCSSNPLELMGLKKKGYVCVTASQWFESSNFWKRDSIDFDNRIANFAECVRVFIEKTKKQAIFVPTVFHDREIGLKLQQILPEYQLKIIPTSFNSKEMAEIIENSWFLLGVRMHSIIFAAKQGVPFLPLVYDEKVLQLLKLLSIEEYSIPLSKVTPDKVENMLESIIDNYDHISCLLREKADEFYRKDMEAISEIKKMLS